MIGFQLSVIIYLVSVVGCRSEGPREHSPGVSLGDRVFCAPGLKDRENRFGSHA